MTNHSRLNICLMEALYYKVSSFDLAYDFMESALLCIHHLEIVNRKLEEF
jgi:hypothetical protein